MFHHLVNSNDLKKVMEEYDLVLSEDLNFIEELIRGSSISGSEWLCKGRTENKSFLYEIVSNKTNGIDVDKMDYLARDCYYLGLKSSFDHNYFLMSARVCEVENRKHICFRDKEVNDAYDLFHTRKSLHRRAYQHKVVNIIEMMIADALREADEHIHINGTDNKQYTISTAVDDMVAYTKLTDNIYQEILNSTSDELKEARDILDKVERRELPKYLGSAKPKVKIEEVNEDELAAEIPKFFEKDSEEYNKLPADVAASTPQTSEEVDLKAEDFIVDVVNMDYGMQNNNPVDKVYFYRKDDPAKASRIPKEQVSQAPERIEEQSIRVYCKKRDEKSVKAAKKSFEKWCEQRGFTMTQ